jgi:hypothetical protein
MSSWVDVPFFFGCPIYILNGYRIVWATSGALSRCFLDFASVTLVIMVEEDLFREGHDAIEIPAFGRGLCKYLALSAPSIPDRESSEH